MHALYITNVSVSVRPYALSEISLKRFIILSTNKVQFCLLSTAVKFLKLQTYFKGLFYLGLITETSHCSRTEGQTTD